MLSGSAVDASDIVTLKEIVVEGTDEPLRPISQSLVGHSVIGRDESPNEPEDDADAASSVASIRAPDGHLFFSHSSSAESLHRLASALEQAGKFKASSCVLVHAGEMCEDSNLPAAVRMYNQALCLDPENLDAQQRISHLSHMEPSLLKTSDKTS